MRIIQINEIPQPKRGSKIDELVDKVKEVLGDKTDKAVVLTVDELGQYWDISKKHWRENLLRALKPHGLKRVVFEDKVAIMYQK